jgi:predicted peptidase
MENLVQRPGKVPIWIFHGEVDHVVNVNGSREPAAALKAAAAYASEEFRNWLFAQQRH